jgi:dTMP kinase
MEARTPRRRRGIFITLEGVEGCGKSTQATRLARTLRGRGYGVVETREPGGTPLAERIRDVLLSSPDEMVSPACEAHLIFAARSQHVAQLIGPALSKDCIVLCDRFTDSTLAYQGYGRGLRLPDLERLNRFATDGLVPDLTLLLDVPITVGLARRRREREQNRLDREARSFHQRVRTGFLKLADRNPRRIKIVDAQPGPDAVEAEIARIVEGLLKNRHPAVRQKPRPGPERRPVREQVRASK